MDFTIRKNNPKQLYNAFKQNSRSPPTDLDLNDVFVHFKSICNNDVNNTDAGVDRAQSCIFEVLDAPISCEEVSNVLKKVKSGKSPGIDNLLYEYFCKFSGIFTPLLSRLFNIIFDQVHFQHVGQKEFYSPHSRKEMLTILIIIEV